MVKKGKGIPVKVRVNQDVSERLDKFAERVMSTKSKVAAEIIAGSLPEAVLLENVGILWLSKWIDEVLSRIAKKGNTPSKERVSVGVWLDENVVSELDRLGEKYNITRSMLAGNMIHANIPNVERFRTIAEAAKWLLKLRKGDFRINVPKN